MTFTPRSYTATEWTSAQKKTDFAKWLVRFIEGGFKLSMFPNTKYRQLRNCFHHIAEFDRDGFHETWFSDIKRQARFLRNIAECDVYGDPAFTYSDVEADIKQYVCEHRLAEIWNANVVVRQEQFERAQLTQLKAKYGEV